MPWPFLKSPPTGMLELCAAAAVVMQAQEEMTGVRGKGFTPEAAIAKLEDDLKIALCEIKEKIIDLCESTDFSPEVAADLIMAQLENLRQKSVDGYVQSRPDLSQ